MVATFARETLEQFIDEALPLFAAHWREVAHYDDIALEPDLDVYAAVQANDRLRVYTVRIDGKLVGYAVYFVGPNMHYRSSKQAKQDLVFVHPDHRRGALGIRLLSYADDQLRAEGTQVVYHHVKLAHPTLGRVLDHLGYEQVETIYAKRLDKE